MPKKSLKTYQYRLYPDQEAKNILKRYLTKRRGANLWGTLVNSKEGVLNHEFSTENPPSSNLIRD
ncbi:MAG: hypothetical protein MRERC_1c129 [Mycoplasmataceae bacterium RC_NB112A]|nr:MAG: hypothetical protein MRERC_1c129 [Mycoplasmataceae bacterium RC_NB112A]